MKSYTEILNEHLEKIKKIRSYNYRSYVPVRKIAEANVLKYFDLEPWEKWICNPRNEIDYTYNIYIPLEYYDIDYPKEFVEDIRLLSLEKSVDIILENSILEEMKEITIYELDSYDTLWLSIDDYILEYYVKILSHEEERFFVPSTGIKISLRLNKKPEIKRKYC